MHTHAKIDYRHIQISPSLGLLPRWLQQLKLGSSQSKELGIQPWSATRVIGLQVLGPSSFAFPCALAGKWDRSGASETPTSTHMGCQCCRRRIILMHCNAGPLFLNTRRQLSSGWKAVVGRSNCHCWC